MKLFKRVFVILLLFAILCGVLEYSAFKMQSKRLISQGYKFKDGVPPYPKNIKTFKDYYFRDFDRNEFLNIKSGDEYKTAPIFVFGDVLSKSVETENENNFNNTLSDITKKPVHNFSNAGWGIQHMYFLLKNEKELDKYNPDTIIYTYNNDNKNRLTSFSFYPHHTFLNLRYKADNNGIKDYDPMFVKIYDYYFIRSLERFLGWRFSTSKNSLVQKKNFELIKKLFESSRNTAQNKYSNLKNFIIIRDVPSFESLNFLERAKKHNKIAELEYNMWQDLKNEGFIVVDTGDLINFDFIDYKYKNNDGSLTTSALKEILPIILKETEPAEEVKAEEKCKSEETAKIKQTTYKTKKLHKKTYKTESTNDNLAWSQIRPEVIGNNFYINNTEYINSEKPAKPAKKSFWSKLKFWNKFKRNKVNE